MNKVVILGNGFDLDLGLKTSYSSFVTSKYWPFPGSATNPNASLKCALQYYCGDYRWMDIEQVIENYATYRDGWEKFAISHKTDDEETFKQLCDSLTNYLLNEQKQPLNKQSMAYRMIDACAHGSCLVYSYNYTYPKGLPITPDKVYYIHGSLVNEIILGVREDVQLLPGYDFLRKTFSRYYSSTDLLFALQESKEIVFFGHSLSPNDYHYFDNFFEQRCLNTITKKDVIRLTFITRNHKSAMEIKKQLWVMNKRRTDRLYTHNIVSFIYTEDPSNEDLGRFDGLLKRLRYLPNPVMVM